MENKELSSLTEKARQIRKDAIEMIGRFGVGHIGGVMSIIEALTTIYYYSANIDPKVPRAQGRDRIIMSKGHAGPAVYSILSDLGYFDKSLNSTLNQNGTSLPSHCDMNKTVGIDMTAGSLGQGLSAGIGMALAAKLDKNPCNIYVVLGDGESQEGQVWEASMLAGSKKLSNLIVLLDSNRLQLDGYVEDINGLEPITDKWRAFNFFVQDVDGHNIEEIANAIDNAKAQNEKPNMIVLRTIKGKGASFAEGISACHSMAISEEMWRKEVCKEGKND
ncbi:MAG: transketolase [Clostridia bacterium]|nr:transketolase [Clostridia bacterium]